MRLPAIFEKILSPKAQEVLRVGYAPGCIACPRVKV